MTIDFDDRRAVNEGGEALLALAERVAEATLATEGVAPKVNMGLILVDPMQMRHINMEFREIDLETDVLSFPTVEGRLRDASPADLVGDTDPATGDLLLGDIIISVERAREQAAEYRHSFEREIGFLVAHGTLHLLGYDHIEQEDEREMRAMEERVLEGLALTREADKERGSMTIDTRALAEAAFAAIPTAYAPYSGYQVGAAVLTEGGEIIAGCNIENASYGLTVCAERVALYTAVSRGARKILAVFVASEGGIAPWPCGACRQVMHEFSGDMVVYAQHRGGKIHMRTLEELLPKAFGPGHLG